MIRVLDTADSTLVEWGRQQQQHDCIIDSNLCVNREILVTEHTFTLTATG